MGKCTLLVDVLKSQLYIFKSQLYIFKSQLYIFKSQLYIFKSQLYIFKSQLNPYQDMSENNAAKNRQVTFAENSLFYRSLLQKRPNILRSLLIHATPYRAAIELTFENRSTVYFPFPDSKRFMNVFQIII